MSHRQDYIDADRHYKMLRDQYDALFDQMADGGIRLNAEELARVFKLQDDLEEAARDRFAKWRIWTESGEQ